MGVLDCPVDEGDQTAGIEIQAPVPVVVRDQKIQTCSQRKAQTEFGEKERLGEGMGKKREKERMNLGSWWGKRGVQ